MPKNKLNLVLQKEYLIIEPTNPRPLIGTESLRSCCGIFIFHPLRSAVLHWDDNSCHNDLDKFIKEYLNLSPIDFKSCTVSLIGGWHDHPESKKAGNFVKQYFETSLITLDLTYFQQKKSTGSLAEQGYSLVYMDSQTGSIKAKDSWAKPIVLDDNKYRGINPVIRNSCRMFNDYIHLQNDDINDSGAHIYARDSYQDLCNYQSTLLCMASKNNDLEQLIKLIDSGVTDVNASPANAKGWTPLHYACKMGQFDAALMLIYNGAKLLQKNEAGKTPLSFVDPVTFDYIRILTAYKFVTQNVSISPYALTSISLFARRHETQIEQDVREQLEMVQKLFETPDGIAEIITMLSPSN